MIGGRSLATTFTKTGVAGGGLLAAAHVPVLTACLVGCALLLITILALTAALSRRSRRRDAAYRVLKLIFDLIRRPTLPTP